MIPATVRHRFALDVSPATWEDDGPARPCRSVTAADMTLWTLASLRAVASHGGTRERREAVQELYRRSRAQALLSRARTRTAWEE
jgi:hypothetical protein